MLRIGGICLVLGLFLFSTFTHAAIRKIRNDFHENPSKYKKLNLFSDESSTPNHRQDRDDIYAQSGYIDPDNVYDDDYYKPVVTDGIKIRGRSKYPNHGFPSKMLPTGKRHVIFNPQYLAWAAYDESGHLVRTGAASGGKAWCSDIQSSCRTPAGSYAVERIMDKSYRSRSFPRRANGNHGGAPMSYAMFFHRGYALHHSNSVPETNASHGCVRMRYDDAKWMNQDFVRIGTQVTVRPYADPPLPNSWAEQVKLSLYKY